ncbi:hypothetical protein F4778DRAFT_714013 [Xylariomycetidae sp. FL2044]|nr:hypothetical protein F4778DRAFT_714013 [Xylariomycetidae sp. FL2044]
MILQLDYCKYFVSALTLFSGIIALSSATILSAPARSSVDNHGTSLVKHLLSSPTRWFSSRRSDQQIKGWIQGYPNLVENVRRYQDQVVIRFNVSTPEHERALRKAIDQMLLDVWDFTSNYTDIRLEARRVPPLMGLLPASLQDNQSVLISNLARAVTDTYPSKQPADNEIQSLLNTRGITPLHHNTLRPKRQGVDDVFFQDYQPLSVVTTWLRLIDSMFDSARIITIGKSYQGRDILGLRVGLQPNGETMDNPNGRRNTILMTGGIHAREWISTTTVNYVAWSFIRSIDQDPMISKILEHFDIVFIPIMNPDGYDYTWTVDRLWRKSRQRTKMQYCPGFDLDHAFGFRWDANEHIEHQNEPCSESYGGDEPFQAIEAAQLANWMRNETDYGSNFVGYLDLHSYSQQVLFPYAYSCAAQPPNLENLEEVAMNLAKHMRLTNGEIYTVASACEGAVTSASESQSTRIEAGGGSAIDYVFHEFGARYSYQIKLRDTGSYGFLLPKEDIIPTGDEMLQAMKYFGDYLLGNNGHESAGAAMGEQEQDHLASDRDETMELRRRRRRRCSDCT